MSSFAPPAVRDWDFPRSVVAVAVLVEEAGARGMPVRRALAGTGLHAGDLSDPDRLVTATQELRVVRNLLAGASPPPTGSEAGRRYHVSSFGIAGYALLSSRTLRDAVEFTLRFVDLTFIFCLPAVRLEGDEVVVELDDGALPADVGSFLRERDLVAIDTVVGELLNESWPSRLSVAEGTLRFPAAYLDKALPQANPATLALCESLCADLASTRRGSEATAQQVRVVLAQRLGYDATMAGVAGALGMSVRTLDRRLAAEGTGFRRLLDEVRCSLAERLLHRGSMGVEDVAARLGYADATAFTRAFRRWRGMTPTAYRLR